MTLYIMKTFIAEETVLKTSYKSYNSRSIKHPTTEANE